jgi:DNA-binding LytR/AlgR family response regulator
MILKSIIVDDEEIAGRGLERYCAGIPFVRLEKICDSTQQAKEVLEKTSIDLVFLDIQMPKQTGLQFLRSLAAPPMVIITTAYPDYAVEGFELDVIDYLVKPFSFERLQKACNKAREYFEIKKGGKHDDYFFIKADNRIEKIEIADILFIEALENYVNICTRRRKYLTLIPLKTLESTLPQSQFIKAQKSFLVAKNKIDSVEGNMLCIGEYKIPISRKWKMDVLNAILTNRFLRR